MLDSVFHLSPCPGFGGDTHPRLSFSSPPHVIHRNTHSHLAKPHTTAASHPPPTTLHHTAYPPPLPLPSDHPHSPQPPTLPHQHPHSCCHPYQHSHSPTPATPRHAAQERLRAANQQKGAESAGRRGGRRQVCRSRERGRAEGGTM